MQLPGPLWSALTVPHAHLLNHYWPAIFRERSHPSGPLSKRRNLAALVFLFRLYRGFEHLKSAIANSQIRLSPFVSQKNRQAITQQEMILKQLHQIPPQAQLPSSKSPRRKSEAATLARRILRPHRQGK
jgi:hypothetical protein